MDGYLIARLRYSHSEGIETTVLAQGESDVLRRELEVGMFLTETTARQFLQFAIHQLTFTEGAPRLAAIDSLTVNLHPLSHLLEHRHTGILNATIRTHGDVEGGIAVATDSLDDEAYH